MKTAQERVRLVIGYVRVSTGQQAATGYSREAQRSILEARIRADYPSAPMRIIEDVGSGARDDRPGMAEVRRLVRSGLAIAVLAVDLDRLTRSVREASELLDLCEAASCRLVVVSLGLDTGSTFGRFAAEIVAAFGDLERRQIRERTRRVHQERRAEGFINPGSRPYGWRDDGNRRLVEVAEEQRWIRHCLAERARGVTWATLADQANSLGICTASGRTWSPQGLRLVVQRASDRLTAIGPRPPGGDEKSGAP